MFISVAVLPPGPCLSSWSCCSVYDLCDRYYFRWPCECLRTVLLHEAMLIPMGHDTTRGCVEVSSICCHLKPFWCLWSMLPLRTLSGSSVLLQLGLSWCPCPLLPPGVMWCPWSVLWPEIMLVSMAHIASKATVMTFVSQGCEGICSLSCGRGIILVCGLYCLRGPYWDPWCCCNQGPWWCQQARMPPGTMLWPGRCLCSVLLANATWKSMICYTADCKG